MKNNRSRFAILAVWAVSLVAAFYLGGQFVDRGGGGNPRTESNDGFVAARPESMLSGSGAQEESPEGGANSGGKKIRGGDVDVSALIARARSQLGGGTGMIYSSALTMKALTPLAGLSEAQVRQALAEVEATVPNPQQKSLFYSYLLGRLAETDGAGAMAFAEENFSGDQARYGAGMIPSIIGTWAREEPEAAWQWYLENRAEAGTERKTNYGQVSALFSAFVSKDVDAAFARLGQLNDAERNQAVSGIARGGTWDPGFREQILEHGSSLPEDARTALYRGVSYQWAMTDPNGAIEWMEGLPAEERKPLIQQAGSTLMMSDPRRGAELMLENASESELPLTYSRVVSQWSSRDPNAAGEWLNQQPQGPELDQARSTFARSVSWRDPASAMEWAKTVENENQRLQAVQQVYGQWKSRDLPSADAALDGSGLSADEIAGIRENASKQPNFRSGGSSAIQIFR